MYAVEVRDRIMIAHSLPDPFFGPAQHMHGATFVVDVAFFREALTRQNVVVDIGAALDVLNKTLKPLAYLPHAGQTTRNDALNVLKLIEASKNSEALALMQDKLFPKKIPTTMKTTFLNSIYPIR